MYTSHKADKYTNPDNLIATNGNQINTLSGNNRLKEILITANPELMQQKFREFHSLQKQQDSDVNEKRKAKGLAVANNLNKEQRTWEQKITKRRPRPVTVSNVPYVEGENLIQIVQKVFDVRNENMQSPLQRKEMKFTAKRAIAKDAKIDLRKLPPKISSF